MKFRKNKIRGIILFICLAAEILLVQYMFNQWIITSISTIIFLNIFVRDITTIYIIDNNELIVKDFISQKKN